MNYRRFVKSIKKECDPDHMIMEGDDITVCRSENPVCYWVEKVIDQHHLIVGRYIICSDPDKEAGSQDWLFFKTQKDFANYQNEWYYNNTDVTEEVYEPLNEKPYLSEWVFTDKWMSNVSDTELHDLNGDVFFGVKRYFYDWDLEEEDDE